VTRKVAGVDVRVIPRLDIKGPNLVKGIHLEGLRVLGRPEQFAELYYEAGADELLYMDAVASLYGRNSLAEIVERTSRVLFVPLCVGGGLRTIDDIRQVLRAGADKVALNTGAMKDPTLISRAVKSFGSSTVVVSMEVIHTGTRYECFTDFGREASGVDAFEWAERAAELGAGELLVTSVDRDGTGRGFDLDLVRGVAERVSIPVIASGGAGTVGHVAEVIDAGADAVAIASLLHYAAVDMITLDTDDFSTEGNIEFRLRGGAPRAISAVALGELKHALHEAGVAVRT
jgi:cyclase